MSAGSSFVLAPLSLSLMLSAFVAALDHSTPTTRSHYLLPSHCRILPEILRILLVSAKSPVWLAASLSWIISVGGVLNFKLPTNSIFLSLSASLVGGTKIDSIYVLLVSQGWCSILNTHVFSDTWTLKKRTRFSSGDTISVREKGGHLKFNLVRIFIFQSRISCLD